MLKTYWDLEEKERAALTRDEVERFLDAELMTKGVLKVAPLVLDAETEISEPTAATFYQVGPVAFTSAASAEAFINLAPVTIETKYLAGGYRSTVCIAAPIDAADVTEKRLVSQSEFALKHSDLERRAAVRDSNARRSEEHVKACKAQEKVLAGVWEDWTRCRNVDEAHRRVVSTFDAYVFTAAGDRDTAARFLAKVFTVAAINEARAWCEVEIPDPGIVDAQFAEAEPAPPTENEMVF